MPDAQSDYIYKSTGKVTPLLRTHHAMEFLAVNVHCFLKTTQMLKLKLVLDTGADVHRRRIGVAGSGATARVSEGR